VFVLTSVELNTSIRKTDKKFIVDDVGISCTQPAYPEEAALALDRGTLFVDRRYLLLNGPRGEVVVLVEVAELVELEELAVVVELEELVYLLESHLGNLLLRHPRS
jgi:hypothetical protein